MADFQLILLSKRERPVRLAQSGAECLLVRFPIEIRMAAASSFERKITEEEIASWYTPIQACAYAATCVGVKASADAVWQLLSGGMIEAVATSSSRTPKDRDPITNSQPSFVPREIWQHISNTGTNLWSGGYARFWVPSTVYGMPYAHQYFGIKLNPADIQANLPPPNPTLHTPKPKIETAQPTPTLNKGGRPRKDYWDDLWAEICGQIYEGKLIPERQADIEKAMLDWATNHGHELSEAGARQRARILFNRLKT